MTRSRKWKQIAWKLFEKPSKVKVSAWVTGIGADLAVGINDEIVLITEKAGGFGYERRHTNDFVLPPMTWVRVYIRVSPERGTESDKARGRGMITDMTPTSVEMMEASLGRED